MRHTHSFRYFLHKDVLISVLSISVILFCGELYKYSELNAPILEKSSTPKIIRSVKEIEATRPALSAQSYIVVWHSHDDMREKVLTEYNADKIRYIASMTKLVSMMVVHDILPLDKKITIKKEDLDETQHTELSQGDIFSVDTLIHLSLIESNNDAVMALANVYGKAKFVVLMNDKVRQMGLKNTHFGNPVGLDPTVEGEEGNTSSARDVVSILAYMKKHYPYLFHITEQKTFRLENPRTKMVHIAENTNKLAGEEIGVFVAGGKTGTTDFAATNLVTVAWPDYGEGYLVAAVLGSKDHIGDMQKLLSWVGESVKF